MMGRKGCGDGMKIIGQTLSRGWLILMLLGWVLAVSGCDDSSSKKSEPEPEAEEEVQEETESENETVTRSIVAYGDSITTGEADPGSASYPSRLSKIIGETVENRGVGGISTCRASNNVDSILSRKPRIVLILLGTNDVLAYHVLATSKECLRNIIRQVRKAGGKPVIATIPPMTGDMDVLMSRVAEMNGHIRSLASEEGATLVDIAAEFDIGEGLMLADGFHPNATGAQIIAFAFAAVL